MTAGVAISERTELLSALRAAGLRDDTPGREVIFSLFARVRAERDEAVRQLGVMRATIEGVKSILKAGRQAEVARRALTYLETPIAERQSHAAVR